MKNLGDPSMALLAASGGDTVKVFDVSVEKGDPCVLTYKPSPSYLINSLKWNHTNLVLATAGEDKKISFWRKNGHSLGTVPVAGDNIEESILAINFSNKGSRYLCSGGSGQVVRIWDLQWKRCIKWLKGHTSTIMGVMYNCKDEHLASISLSGDLILHNLASGARAAELKDPNEQVLRVLDYSRISRHLLATAGDDGSVHLWDTTGRKPKVSWLKQHSAPTAGIGFSPSNDKMIASVGMDKKLYTYDSGSRRPSSCISYEAAPFSSLAFRDDGWILAAGTSSGLVVFYDVRGKPQPFTVLRAYESSEAVTSLCWQRAKSVIVNESGCSDETALLGVSVEDSILMPDPLPSVTSSSITQSTAVGSRKTGHSGSSVELLSTNSGSAISTPNLSISEGNPLRNHLWPGGTLSRLHAPYASYNFKDDMEVFSPLVDVQPITPSLDKLWDYHEGTKKESPPTDKKPPSLFPSSRRFAFGEDENSNHPVFDWKSNSSSKQDDTHSSFTLLGGSTPSPVSNSEDASGTPPEAWGGERLSDKLTHLHQPLNFPSRFGMFATGSLTSDASSNQETSTGLQEQSSSSMSLSLGTKGVAGPTKIDAFGIANVTMPRRFSTYAERISSTSSFSDGTFFSGSPKMKKTGAETREELLNSLLSRSETLSVTESGTVSLMNVQGVTSQPHKTIQPDPQQGNSFTLQLFQRTLEDTLDSFQKSVHEDMRNLHIEILRQFHTQEMEFSNVMTSILDKQAELMKEIRSLRKENQELRQML